MWMSYLPEARAVLGAINDPDDAMIGAGSEAVRGLRPNSRDHATAVWRAMLGAADPGE